MYQEVFNKIFQRDPNLFLIAGPCVVENEDLAFRVAEQIKDLTSARNIPFIFKSSFKKANRTKLDSFTGIGDQEALQIMKRVGTQLQVPTITDIHEIKDIENAQDFVDVFQIPAFLCRQTDLLTAAAQTGKPVNVKKGQFLAPNSAKFMIDKVVSTGNNQVMVTERGTTFGYNNLVVDMCGIPTMRSFNKPVVLDVTHSLQQPNQASGVTGGNPEMISTLARAGVAAGVNGIFLETHPNPAEALSDGANMLPLSQLESVLDEIVAVHETMKKIGAYQ